MATRTDIQPGWDVYSSEGEHIGSISDVQQSYLVITKGMFLPKDHYVPLDAITDVRSDQGQVLLNCTKGEFDSMGWDQVPDTGSDRTTSAGAAYDTWSGTDADATAGTTRTTTDTADTAGGSVDTGETRRIPRYEEELRAEKSSQQTGEVRVTKDVTEEEQSLEVPVTREDVEVRRVAVNRPASGTEEAFNEGDTIRVPIRGEEVHVTKEPRVVEELEIRKTAHEERQRVGDTVRKEQVNVEQTGDKSGDVYADDRQLAGAGAGADRFESQRGWDAGTPSDQRDYQAGGGIPDHGNDTEIGGGAAGAVGGAAVGGAVGGPPGAVIGGVAGAVGGAAAGDAVDKDEDSDKTDESRW